MCVRQTVAPHHGSWIIEARRWSRQQTVAPHPGGCVIEARVGFVVCFVVVRTVDVASSAVHNKNKNTKNGYSHDLWFSNLRSKQ